MPYFIFIFNRFILQFVSQQADNTTTMFPQETIRRSLQIPPIKKATLTAPQRCSQTSEKAPRVASSRYDDRSRMNALIRNGLYE